MLIVMLRRRLGADDVDWENEAILGSHLETNKNIRKFTLDSTLLCVARISPTSLFKFFPKKKKRAWNEQENSASERPLVGLHNLAGLWESKEIAIVNWIMIRYPPRRYYSFRTSTSSDWYFDFLTTSYIRECAATNKIYFLLNHPHLCFSLSFCFGIAELILLFFSPFNFKLFFSLLYIFFPHFFSYFYCPKPALFTHTSASYLEGIHLAHRTGRCLFICCVVFAFFSGHSSFTVVACFTCLCARESDLL